MSDAPAFRHTYGRAPIVALQAMIATSSPAATRAGLRMYECGGNAIDAALAAAAVLCIAEPMNTGPGGDLFAIVWRRGRAEALDAAGPAPIETDPGATVADRGPQSVTVPGAVAGWAALAERHGKLGLDRCLADAIDLAEEGLPIAPRAHATWLSDFACPDTFGPVTPQVGERFRAPELGATLRAIAERGPPAFYSGRIAEAIAAASWLSLNDLAAYEPSWVEPLHGTYREIEVLELPPPTQGIAALEALGLLQLGSSTQLTDQIECVRLALEDAFEHVRDGADVHWLLDERYLHQRRGQAPRSAPSGNAGTVYLCAIDSERTCVSLIQSIYGSFGSGVVAPGTGVLLQNRGAGFLLTGGFEPGKRPYHTIIPGLLLRDGNLLGSFGVVGGMLQAQAHTQLVSALVDDRDDPQAALDRPRFRVEGDIVRLEEGLWHRAEELERAGLKTLRDADTVSFGVGQTILVEGDVLLGGSDPRGDGYPGAL